jgi:hypothetical protein
MCQNPSVRVLDRVTYGLLAGLLLTGCSAHGDTTAASASASPPATTPPSFAVDWTIGETSELPQGWSLLRSSAASVEVYHGDNRVLLIGIVRSRPNDHFTDVQARAGNVAAIQDMASQFVRAASAQIIKACGRAYQVKPDPVFRLTAADGPVARYGFTASRNDGTGKAAFVLFSGVRDGMLATLNISGSEADSCTAQDGTFSDLTSFLPILEQVIMASDFPP